jgi:hypothetical protein
MRAFRLSDDKPDWEAGLVKSLAAEERRKEKA